MSTRPARQPVREVWSHERLVHERAIVLGNAMDQTTLRSYGSALNSYLTFVKSHDLPVDPNEDTLSFFTVYMSHHINPRSVNTYLSGIVQQLEPYFPNVREARNSRLVKRTLQGCMRMKGTAVVRKQALTLNDLTTVANHYSASSNHDDILFVAMIYTGFFGLMRLGELTFPDDKSMQNWKKVSRRSSVSITAETYEFHLPSHKADRFFEGNRIIIRGEQFGHHPWRHFTRYISSRDRLHPVASPLWITSTGHIPTRSFFISRLRLFFSKEIAGQSMRAGGATALAENGAPPSIIQATGRWASEAFWIYIRKNPTLIQGLLHARAHGISLAV